MSGIVFSFQALVCCSSVLALELFEQWDVASEHNYHRANVQPSAADMLFMTWYETAEMNAQLLASECKRSKSDPMKDREFGNCSQNIFISPEILSWNEVIATWASGISYFTYGSSQNNVSKIRSFAKIIWAQSHKLGCGFQQCEDENGIFHKHVCNYCPGPMAVKAWYSEVSKFTYGSSSNVFHEIGHYTQLVWAKTYKVGCGLAKCSDNKGTFYNYICNYCPA
ncbi:Hypothetical predicted protein [Cloeon dipterum]|uniref:SCP domain-containing protein n=1 Tax=Cloeon dipterum TaxID=197152 RepID=A0A8S1DG05_9INSE|nr:Hypothetical predicted protein [Cloeon dipterum]